MKLKKLTVNGFRSLVNFSIDFDDQLTVVVGENDAGKSSLIECLQVVTQARDVAADDFTHGMTEMTLTVEIEDFLYAKRYDLVDGRPSEVSFTARGTAQYVARTLADLTRDDFDEMDGLCWEELTSIAKIVGVQVRANSNRAAVKERVLERLRNDPDLLIEDAKFPKFNNIQLNGRHFENVPSFFKEVFLKEKQASLWVEPVGGVSLRDFVNQHLAEYSQEISDQIREKGIIDKLQLFVSELTDIRVEPVFSPRDFNIDARVKFLENGAEISLENRGDGTKRRITMALLEFKKEQARIENQGTVYLLDEPDTHLHVRAQKDLMRTVEGFADSGDQVILTTHSPFILNSVKPQQVRWLTRTEGRTRVRSLLTNAHIAGSMLRNLGIENASLFFCRTILLVEGETEEGFVPASYLRSTGNTLSAGLVKVMNVRGIHNVPGFARAILEIHDPARVLVLHDNDASLELRQLIEELGLPEENRYSIGRREFEDAFDAADLFHGWNQYHVVAGRNSPQRWTVAEIQALKDECAANDRKFSGAISQLNVGGRKMTKPLFGAALGEHTEAERLPLPLPSLFAKLSEG